MNTEAGHGRAGERGRTVQREEGGQPGGRPGVLGRVVARPADLGQHRPLQLVLALKRGGCSVIFSTHSLPY
jgi:hypothetical protein